MLEMLHHQVRRFPFVGELVDLDDVLVLERLAALEFVLQGRDFLAVFPQIGPQHFENVAFLLVGLGRFPHLAGMADANQPHEAIGTEKIARSSHVGFAEMKVGGPLPCIVSRRSR